MRGGVSPRGAALAAEPRPGQCRAAGPAELLGRRRGRQAVPAALAELAAAGLLAAVRAQPGGLVAVVDVPGPVLALDLLIQLVDLRRGLHPGDLLVQLGGAGHAQAPLAVPAHLPAHPLAAPVALVEERLHLLHCPGQRLVPGRAAHTVPHPLGVPADLLGLLANGATHQVATEPQHPAAEAGDRMLERRAVPVAAATAEELELVSLAGTAVLVVVRKVDHPGHGASPFIGDRGTLAGRLARTGAISEETVAPALGRSLLWSA